MSVDKSMAPSPQWLWRIPGRGWNLENDGDNVPVSCKVNGEWVTTDVIPLNALTTPSVVEEAVKAEEHASPRPWVYRRREFGPAFGGRDWIEDANGSVVVENVGHIDGPLICAAVNARARSATP